MGRGGGWQHNGREGGGGSSHVSPYIKEKRKGKKRGGGRDAENDTEGGAKSRVSRGRALE